MGTLGAGPLAGELEVWIDLWFADTGFCATSTIGGELDASTNGGLEAVSISNAVDQGSASGRRVAAGRSGAAVWVSSGCSTAGWGCAGFATATAAGGRTLATSCCDQYAAPAATVSAMKDTAIASVHRIPEPCAGRAGAVMTAAGSFKRLTRRASD